MRGAGRVYRQRGSEIWWLDYGVHGVRHRESSGLTSKKEAQQLLRQRIGDRETGKIIGHPDRVVLAQYVKDENGTDKLVGGLRALVERQYVLDGRKSIERVHEAFQHLEEFFGPEVRAMQITRSRLDSYAQHRLAAGRARATVNNELAQLRRGFRLAIEAGLLGSMPVFKLPKVHNARCGFLDGEHDFPALMVELAADLRPLIHFLYLTGWRRDEARLLRWTNVDFEGEVLTITETKSGEPRVFPFGTAPELKQLLEAQWGARDGLYVFHRHGSPIGVGALRSGWKRATKRAGLDGKLVHDLRRTAARDMRRAGLAESDIMELAGWETREMFKRYAIKDEKALAAAVAKRFTPAPAATA